MSDFPAAGDWRDTIISIVENAKDVNTIDIPIGRVLDYIRDGRWNAPVTKIRKVYADSLERAERNGSLQPHRVAKDAIAGFKKKLPGFTVSGQFKKRAASDLIVHSGIFCVDMDLVSPEERPGLIERLKEDPHVQVVFVSPSGWGLKVLVSIQPDPHTSQRCRQPSPEPADMAPLLPLPWCYGTASP
jgi:hypothetical protein